MQVNGGIDFQQIYPNSSGQHRQGQGAGDFLGFEIEAMAINN